MAYPAVMALTAPSRGGDPGNFPGEAAVYLSALSTYGPQSTALANYLNALPMLRYQWGLLVQTNPVRPSALAAFPTRPTGGDTGLIRSGRIDSMAAASETLATRQNQIGAFMDALSTLSGAVSLAADASRPAVTGLAAAPLRSDPPTNFEPKSVAFFESLAAHNNNLDPLVDYYNALITSEDWDLVTAPVDSTDDFGLITEAADG